MNAVVTVRRVAPPPQGHAQLPKLITDLDARHSIRLRVLVSPGAHELVNIGLG